MNDFDPAPVARYIELGGIIERLEREDPNRVLPLGFANPHSFRGDYADLAFEPVRNIAIGDMLAAARSALGATFQGWKGGEYEMWTHTDCWIAVEGEDSDNKIGPLLLETLLDGGKLRIPLERIAQAAERYLAAEHPDEERVAYLRRQLGEAVTDASIALYPAEPKP